MRYLVKFYDGKTKRIDEEHIEAFKLAMRNRGVVEYRGAMYAGASIEKITTMKDWIEEERRNGARICRYGEYHAWDDRCECKTLGLQLLPPDERALISLPEPMREVALLQEAPQTDEEKRRAEVYERERTKYLRSHEIPAAPKLLPVGSCGNCKGTGKMPLEGHTVTCVCVTDQMDKAGAWAKP